MKKVYLTVMFCLITALANAGDITVSVIEVRDSRTTGQFFAGLDLKVRAMGDLIADAKGLRIDVTKAVDDTGRDLLKKDDAKRTEFAKTNENNAGQAEVEIKLKNPSRKASVIKELSGDITVFVPGKDPNALATIEAFMTMTGRPVTNKALKAARVELSVMTRKQFDEFKEQQKKEVKAKEGEMVKEFGEAMAKALGSLFGGMMEIGENSVILNITDPDSRVIEIEFIDAAGTPVRSGSSMKTGDLRVFEFDQPMPQNAKLKISMITPSAVTKSSFKISDIALP
jgi:hypothetical protein